MHEKVRHRPLVFADFDDVIRDVEQLQAKGYSKAGNWDLAQVCGHLADWMSYPLDGFPKTGFAIGTLLWMLKVTVGKAKFRQMLATGKMPSGKPTMPQTAHPAGGDETAAVNRLKEAARRFKEHKGEVHPSPLFGNMTYEEAKKLQLIHCAHHLSFLIPKQSR